MWHKLPLLFNAESISKMLKNSVELVETATVQSEAVMISLMLRKADEDGKKAALITPDRQLARRVQNELKRWNIHVDDSSGVPLSDTPSTIFLMHVVNVKLQKFSPSALLGLLKHSHFSSQFGLAMSKSDLKIAVYSLELILFRGVRPASDLKGLLANLQMKQDEIFADNATYQYMHPLVREISQNDWQLVRRLLEALEDVFSKFKNTSSRNFADIFADHLAIAEQLSQMDEAGNSLMWQSHEGDGLAHLSSEILQSKPQFNTVSLEEYEPLLKQIISGNMVRAKGQSYAGLAILGAMEARLADLDVAILGGLNEGVWPQIPQADAWVSRKMMAEIGLPAPERRVGLSAHDFVAAFSVKQVYITRAEKLGGAPTVASRWLLRLKAVLNALGIPNALNPSSPWQHWATELDRPSEIVPNIKPEPRPPVAARPSQMSVTDIETWIRDPYAIYVKKILKISPLDELEMEINAAEKGSLFHDILHQFSLCYEGEIGGDALPLLINIGENRFVEIKNSWPELYAFWWPRFLRVAEWFLNQEAVRRNNNPTIYAEIKGQMCFESNYGTNHNQPFTVTARADRIDIYSDEVDILDYKTGVPPTPKQVSAGFAPQLLLEAAILADGGFKTIEIDKSLPINFAYMQLTGAYPAGKMQSFKRLDSQQLVDDILVGLKTRIADFAIHQTAYKPRELAEFAARFRDYDQLSRMKEWALIEGDD